MIVIQNMSVGDVEKNFHVKNTILPQREMLQSSGLMACHIYDPADCCQADEELVSFVRESTAAMEKKERIGMYRYLSGHCNISYSKGYTTCRLTINRDI